MKTKSGDCLKLEMIYVFRLQGRHRERERERGAAAVAVNITRTAPSPTLRSTSNPESGTDYRRTIMNLEGSPRGCSIGGFVAFLCNEM